MSPQYCSELYLNSTLLEANQQLLGILEKTNQQLSFWWSPFNTILVILAVLVAVIAIGMGLITGKQHRDYKKAHKEFLASLNEKTEASRIMLEQKYDELIEKGKEMLEATSGQERQKIADEIQKLESDRSVMTASMISPSSTGLGLSYTVSAASNLRNCSKCNRVFAKPNPLLGTITAVSLGWTCPDCNHFNMS